MASLLELQRRFACALEARADDASPGMAVYRHAIASNYRRALAATYPVVRALLGDRAFDAAVDGLVRADPPTCGDLNVYGADFASFIAADVRDAACDAIAALARLEWALDEASRAAEMDAPPSEVIAAIAMVPEDALSDMRLALHPSCRFVASSFAVLDAWRAHQAGCVDEMRRGIATMKDERLLVRRVGADVLIEPLAAGEFEWLRALHENDGFGSALSVAQRAQPAFDLAAALERRVHDGTIRAVAAAQSSVM